MNRRIDALLVVWAVLILAGLLIGGEIGLHISDTFSGLLAGLAAGK